MNMKAEIINPFLQATVSVLKTIASVDPLPGKPYIKKGDSAKGDISGIVGITGDTEGTLCISFSKKCILFIVSKIYGEDKVEIDSEVKDAVGELTNMISGDSRRRLAEIGYHFIGAIPSVIIGEGHEIKHITKGPILVIPFRTQPGDFFVEVCFK